MTMFIGVGLTFERHNSAVQEHARICEPSGLAGCIKNMALQKNEWVVKRFKIPV